MALQTATTMLLAGASALQSGAMLPGVRSGAAVSMMAKSKVAPMFDAPAGMKGFVGEEDGFDPLGLSDIFDMKWLREAELKHGRICMLAFVGFIFPDIFWKLPDHPWSSVAAHDAQLVAMQQIFMFVGLVEVLTGVPAINYTMNGGDREPGDFTFDPLGFIADATPEAKETMQLKELKNGRLAMLGFSGIVTQAALGHPDFPYV